VTPIKVTVYAGGFLEGVVFVDDWTIAALKGKKDHTRWIGGENYNKAVVAVLKTIQKTNKLFGYKITEPRKMAFRTTKTNNEMILVDIKKETP
jgi:hypothetical protein